MTKSQKIIVALLTTVAIIVLAAVGCALFFVVSQRSSADAVAPAVAQEPSPTSAPASTSTAQPSPSSTPAPTQRPEPSATPTLVVVETVQPSPTPTIANCITEIRNFGDSGVLTDAQVEQYLRRVIPSTHLDRCRRIEYVHVLAQQHGSAIGGNIIPVYREIYVYAYDLDSQDPEFLVDTIVHEIGHNVHMNFRRENFDLDVRWAELHRVSGFVSDYAQTSKFEDFAELYLAYIRYPELLQAVSSDKYDFMRLEIFNGLEY